MLVGYTKQVEYKVQPLIRGVGGANASIKHAASQAEHHPPFLLCNFRVPVLAVENWLYENNEAELRLTLRLIFVD